MQEDFHLLVYAFDDVLFKEGIYQKRLVIFLLKAVNLLWSFGHGLAEDPFSAQVVPRHLNKFSCAVPEFLCGGEHVELLVQQLPNVFLVETVLSHYQHELEPNCTLL